jgi:hypothetical protein
MDILYCMVCDADASATVIIAHWHDTNICTDCLAAREAMEEDMGDDCDCVACLRIQRKNRLALD